MQRYLFVHFKEKTSPDGEQVYFSLSEDGFNWQPVNGGQPCALGLLWRQGRAGSHHYTQPSGRHISYFLPQI